MSKTTLQYLIESQEVVTMCKDNDHKFNINEVKEISDHEAGVNQVLRISKTEIATASHDFTIKFWDTRTYELTKVINTETCNSMCLTGFKGKYLVTGYPNGDIVVYNSRKKTELGTV